MGETLTVREGEKVEVKLVVVDPEGANNSKYAFNNPSLLQIGIEEPINEPSLRQVDLIMGQVGELILPTDQKYYNPLAPATTVIAESWYFSEERGGKGKGKKGKERKMRYSFKAENDSYIRVRGSNIPVGTPNERDEYGNPLSDHLTDNIPCDDEACPPHLGGTLTADAEAWADIWFHANPIFIEIEPRGKGKGKKK